MIPLLPAIGLGIQGVSLASKLLGGKKKRRPETASAGPSNDDRRGQLLTMLMTDAQQARSDVNNPLNSSAFMQGRASLLDSLKNIERRDSGAAAMRGLTGGEFEIAQGANRGRALVSGLRDLQVGAQGQAENTQARLMQQLLSLQGMSDQVEQHRLDRKESRNARKGAGLASALSALPGAAVSLYDAIKN